MIRLVFMVFGCLVLSFGAVAKSKSKSKKLEKKLVNKEFNRLLELYKMRAMKPGMLWRKFGDIQSHRLLTPGKKLFIHQIQAELLLRDGFPVLAASYASNVLKKAAKPLSTSYVPSWAILEKVSRIKPIQFILEDLSLSLNLNGKIPPKFGQSWNYFVGNALVTQGFDEKGLAFFKRVPLSSRYFMPAKYQIGMIDYSKGRFKSARGSLRAILHPSTDDTTPLGNEQKLEMRNYAHMALGRILYEQKKFINSARQFRLVNKESPLFYDALYEQSWALFMSGNPNHALGSLYGAGSTYFNDIYNPEAKVLEAVVYYWMCRYGDARNSLADFAQRYSESVESLSDYIDRRKFSPKSGYHLFENLVTGVSSEALGIPRDVLQNAANRDTMLLVREQLASVMMEAERLQNKGIFRSNSYTRYPLKKIDGLRKVLRDQLGTQFVMELKRERENYEKLYSQSQFLYLELLMSEKEQLLGRELHASSKVSGKASYEEIMGWGRNTQGWKGDRLGEYWWDEIGFHIVQAKSKCVQK